MANRAVRTVRCEATQFAVAATNNSALSSDENRSHEMRSDEMRCDEMTEIDSP